MLETLISVALFFTICLTLLPIQYQLLLEKKITNDEEIVMYFLSEELHKTMVSPIVEDTIIYNDILSTPVTLRYTTTTNLIKGCVSWRNAKQRLQTKCLYGKPI
ncbi:hypothetical protein [Gracilibacillus boraciitolerans]|uniref:hypothetical protein n=1 Tax=Gracilibacillus boraciitolerans TaxID=307521 RepID=UPI00054E83F3|nr:hypothetical protein [Gracilibacillus boraciitolerans]